MNIYLKEKDLQLFILQIKIWLKMGSLTKKKQQQIRRYWRLYHKTNKKKKIKALFIEKFILINRDSLQK